MPRKAIVVGAGPVGCLSALALLKAGWSVTLYDARPGMNSFTYNFGYSLTHGIDMRMQESKNQLVQRSINLAISSRGIAALHSIDPQLAERFLKTVIPMRGRMIHPTHGPAESQLYDLNGQVRDFTWLLWKYSQSCGN